MLIQSCTSAGYIQLCFLRFDLYGTFKGPYVDIHFFDLANPKYHEDYSLFINEEIEAERSAAQGHIT